MNTALQKNNNLDKEKQLNQDQKKSRKKLCEFSCYLKIERNAIAYSSKNFNPFGLQKIVVYEEEIETESLNKLMRMIHLNSSNNENIFTFETKNIEKIVDKLINEGKITLLLNLNQKNVNEINMSQKNKSNQFELENYVIFISQSTRQILENFLKYIQNFNLNEKSNNINKNLNNNVSNGSHISIKKEINNLNLDSRFGKKRKFKDLYKEYEEHPKIQALIVNKNNKKIIEKTERENLPIQILKGVNKNKPLELKNKFVFEKVPFIYIIEIFQYLDKDSSNNFSLVNKRIKKLYDGFMENLELRADTPAAMIKKILTRYENLRKLKLGRGKKIKNEIFNDLNSNLKNLIYLDISEIDNLNENSIKKILSKTKPLNIISFKMNFDLGCLNPVLSYLLEFTVKIEELCVNSKNISFYLKTKEEGENLNNLLTINKITSIQYHELLKNFLLTKCYLKKIELFLMNFSLIDKIFLNNKSDSDHIINTNKGINLQKLKNSSENKILNPKYLIFSQLKVLHLEVIVIKKIKDLKILRNAIHLEQLSIQNILFLETLTNTPKHNEKKIKQDDLFYCKLFKINFQKVRRGIEEIEQELNNNFNFINNNLSNIVNLNNEDVIMNENPNDFASKFDVDEDYVDTFIEIFSNIRNLYDINMGEFINGEILKVICNFSKRIKSIKLNSSYLIDDDINVILKKMNCLESLDLRGCSKIYGVCFLELDKLPEKLKKVKLSLVSFNFYNLIEYLRKNNIEAINYI